MLRMNGCEVGFKVNLDFGEKGGSETRAYGVP
jgi:hypothetical protein